MRQHDTHSTRGLVQLLRKQRHMATPHTLCVSTCRKALLLVCSRAGQRAIAAGAAVEAAPQRPGQRVCSAAAGAGPPGVATQHDRRRCRCGCLPAGNAAACSTAHEQCQGRGRTGASHNGFCVGAQYVTTPSMSSCFTCESHYGVLGLQAVMQHLAGDDFWHSAGATSTRLQSPHEVGMNML